MNFDGFLQYNWLWARSQCQKLGAELASVESRDELNFIQKLKGRFHAGHWLGGVFSVEEEEWVWTDGTNFDSELWNKKTGTVGKCLSIDPDSELMISSHCFEKLWPVCSKNI